MEDHEAIFYTVQQVARRYGVSTRVIYEALQRGYIKGVRLGVWRASEEALQEFERSGGIPGRRTALSQGDPPTQGIFPKRMGHRRQATGAVVKKISI